MQIPLEERLQRLEAWFHRKNDRPLIGFFADSQYPLHRYRGAKNLPDGEIQPKDVKAEHYLDDTDRLFNVYEEMGGDYIWSAAPYWGMPWVEASLGCKVIADLKAGSTHTQPPPDFQENLRIPKFSPDNPWVAKMLEFIPALEERSGGRYPVGMTLMRGISDLLSALYGGERFLFRMYEAPDEVKSIVNQLTEYWIQFGKCLLDHLPLYRGGTGAFFYAAWCPGKTIWFQEDAAALLSPDLYEEFIYPSVCKIAESFDHSVIHLHPSQFIPADYLVKTKVNVIELHRDVGGPTAEQLASYHKTILAEKPLIIWGDLTDEDFDHVLKNLPHEGLAVIMVVDSIEKSAHVWEKAMKLIKG
jgi:hypothetical protein